MTVEGTRGRNMRSGTGRGQAVCMELQWRHYTIITDLQILTDPRPDPSIPPPPHTDGEVTPQVDIPGPKSRRRGGVPHRR